MPAVACLAPERPDTLLLWLLSSGCCPECPVERIPLGCCTPTDGNCSLVAVTIRMWTQRIALCCSSQIPPDIAGYRLCSFYPKGVCCCYPCSTCLGGWSHRGDTFSAEQVPKIPWFENAERQLKRAVWVVYDCIRVHVYSSICLTWFVKIWKTKTCAVKICVFDFWPKYNP